MTSYQVGRVIRGKYRIERVLGQGGMGVVVAAQHVALDQRVAIKFLLPAMLENADLVARFAREARAASRIQSDHVARVIDVDALEDGAPFIVMEYLDGSDLSNTRKNRQPLPPHVAAAYVIEACEAIGEAHALGIVHRDIKPANLFLARRAGGKTRVKVLDFGISKMDAGAQQGSVTRTSVVIGSAEYMSPEQMLSTRDVDGRTDIWSLGVTLYEITTGRVPFPGETLTQVCAQVMCQPAAPPSCHLPGISPAFDAVVLRCLEKERSQRYASTAELAAALAPFVRREVSSPDVLPSSPRTQRPGGTLALDDGRPAARSGSMSAPGTALQGGPGGITNGALYGGAPGPPAASRAPIALAMMSIFAGGAGAAFFLLRGLSPGAASAPHVAVARTGLTVPAFEVQMTGAARAIESTPVAPSPPAPRSPGSSPSPAPAMPPRARPLDSASPPRPPAASKVNCSPPFVFDASGMKHAKPECL